MSFLKGFRKNKDEGENGQEQSAPLSNNEEVLNKLQRIPIPGRKTNIVESGMVQEATATGKDVFIRLKFDQHTARGQRVIDAQVRNGMKALGYENINIKIEGIPIRGKELPVTQPAQQRPQQAPQQEAKLSLIHI